MSSAYGIQTTFDVVHWAFDLNNKFNQLNFNLNKLCGNSVDSDVEPTPCLWWNNIRLLHRDLCFLFVINVYIVKIYLRIYAKQAMLSNVTKVY